MTTRERRIAIVRGAKLAPAVACGTALADDGSLNPLAAWLIAKGATGVCLHKDGAVSFDGRDGERLSARVLDDEDDEPE